MISGSASGWLGLPNQAFGVRCVAAGNFSHLLDSCNFGTISVFFSMALGPILMTFGALEAGLKFDDFRWLSGGGGRAEQPWLVGASWSVPRPYCSRLTVRISPSTCKIQHQTCRDKGIWKNQDANCGNTKSIDCNIISFTHRDQDTGKRRFLAACWPLCRAAGGLMSETRSCNWKNTKGLLGAAWTKRRVMEVNNWVLTHFINSEHHENRFPTFVKLKF